MNNTKYVYKKEIAFNAFKENLQQYDCNASNYLPTRKREKNPSTFHVIERSSVLL